MYWLLISSTLYDVYTQQARRGAIYQTPAGNTSIHLYQLGFVDDVNNRTNLPWKDDINEDADQITRLITQASRESQLWHDLLESTNQLFELSSSKYHIIRHKFHPSGKAEMVTDDLPPKLR
jgi:hypothetical protein